MRVLVKERAAVRAAKITLFYHRAVIEGFLNREGLLTFGTGYLHCLIIFMEDRPQGTPIAVKTESCRETPVVVRGSFV